MKISSRSGERWPNDCQPSCAGRSLANSQGLRGRSRGGLALAASHRMCTRDACTTLDLPSLEHRPIAGRWSAVRVRVLSVEVDEQTPRFPRGYAPRL